MKGKKEKVSHRSNLITCKERPDRLTQVNMINKHKILKN